MKISCQEGAYLIPQGTCVSCGRAVGLSEATLKTGGSSMSGKRFVTLKFPLCEDCDSVRERVKAARKSRKRFYRRLAVPLALAVSGLFVLANGGVDSWGGLGFLFVVAWFVIYRLTARVFRDVGQGAAAPPDRAGVKAIEASAKVKVTEGVAGFGAGTVFEFANPVYAREFEASNALNIKKRAA